MKRLLLLIIFVGSSLSGMYEYRQARNADVPALLKLINEEAINDRDRIVVLPERFREGALQGAIQKGRLFVAAQDDVTIVGYKKLFLVADEGEKVRMLQDEIRCVGPQSVQTYAGRIDGTDTLVHNCMPEDVDPRLYATCIYNGGDFTSAEHRAKGINRSLTDKALALILSQVQKHMRKHKKDAVTMIYGLTEANAGLEPGVKPDRTPSIAQSFKAFVCAMEQSAAPVELSHYRYKSFMPTFDPASDECKPLPDDRSVAGFGCVLSYMRAREA